MSVEDRIQCFIDKGRFTTPRHPCYAYHHPQGEFDSYVLQIVARAAF